MIAIDALMIAEINKIVNQFSDQLKSLNFLLIDAFSFQNREKFSAIALS